MTEGRGSPSGGRSLTLLRGALFGLAGVVILQAAFGFAGALRATPLVIGTLALAGGLAVLRRAARRAPVAVRPPHERWTASDGAGAAALLLALATRAWEGLHRDTFPYDVLSYHLHLPASWHALGRLALIPTPFGDQAPAYAPANAELIFELAMALTGNLRLAQAGQVPFAALAALAIYATARGVGARRSVGFAAALAFLLVPEVWQQATGAMTDLALASCLLATLPFLAALHPSRSRWDVAALGAATGLALGTKYVGALMLAPLAVAMALSLLPVAAAARKRPAPSFALAAVALRATAVMGLAFLCGGFWYVRNLLLTGNPTFPVALQLGPFTLAPGLYGGAAMRAWTYHLPVFDLHPLLEMFSETTLGFLGSALLATLASLRGARGRWLLLLLGLVALGWLVVPYQQSRFFFCAWGVLTVVMVDGGTALPSRLRGLLLVPALAGSALQFPTPARLVVALLATAGLMAEALKKESGPANGEVRSPWPRAHRAARLAGAVLLVGGVGGAIVWARGHAGCPPYAVGDAHDEAWAFVARQGQSLRVAYAGSNLPVPLWGPRLENFVQYVNIGPDRHAYLHNFRMTMLSTSPSAEPAPERALPDRGAWLSHLEAARIDTLFVAALYPEVQPSMTHDADGFPIERTWADALPDRFAPLFANPGVRIYRLRPAGETGSR